MSHITLDQANRIVEAAFAKGKELGLKPLSVAVLDAGSHLIAFQRQDGASTLRPQIATGKASGALALVILLDQFPRNAFRGTAHMYATDPLARHHARDAIAQGHPDHVDPRLRIFFYLPFEHSEDLADQDLSVALHASLVKEDQSYAERHRDIIRRFGRFPHRNTVLLRETTAEEQAYLDEGGFAG